MQETHWVRDLGSGRFSWRREWLPTPVFLPGKSRGQRGLAGYLPWSRRVKHDWATIISLHTTGGFPGGASGKESAWQSRRHKRSGLDPWVWKVPWRREWLPTPVFLPGKVHGQKSLVVYSPGVTKSQTLLSTAHADTYHRSLALKELHVLWKPEAGEVTQVGGAAPTLGTCLWSQEARPFLPTTLYCPLLTTLNIPSNSWQRQTAYRLGKEVGAEMSRNDNWQNTYFNATPILGLVFFHLWRVLLMLVPEWLLGNITLY